MGVGPTPLGLYSHTSAHVPRDARAQSWARVCFDVLCEFRPNMNIFSGEILRERLHSLNI